MNLYKISVSYLGYDTYDSAIVVAESRAKARMIHPDGRGLKVGGDRWFDSWVKDPKIVSVKLIGKTNLKREQVILASFNEG